MSAGVKARLMLLLPTADLLTFQRFQNLFSVNSVNSVSMAAAAPDAAAAPAVFLVTVGRPR